MNFNILGKQFLNKLRLISINTALIAASLTSLSSEAFGDWRQVSLTTNRAWWKIDCSSDGTHVAVVYNPGRIYVSNNSGTTWNEVTSTGSQYFRNITVSSDGSKMVAVVGLGSTSGIGNIWYSADYGSTWTENTTSPGSEKQWEAVAFSKDGSTLIAGARSDVLYKSEDAGLTWSALNSGSEFWNATSISDDGQKIVASLNSSPYYKYSIDGGTTWNNATAPSFASSAMTHISGTGEFVSVPSNSGQILISNSTGSSWSELRNESGGFRGIASSSDGALIYVGLNNSYLYQTNRDGTEWNEITTVSQTAWRSICMSDDGTKVYAAARFGGVWTTAALETFTPIITVTGSISYTYNASPQVPSTSTVTGESGQPDPTGTVTYSYSGTGTTTYGPSATQPTDVGTYKVTATIAADTLYSEATSDAFSFSINAKEITGTIIAADKAYDGTTAATITNRELQDVALGDDVSLTGGTATFNNASVGTGKSVFLASPSLTGADAGNYKIPGDFAFIAQADITAKPITVTGSDAYRSLFESNPEFGFEDFSAQLASGDSVADLTGGTGSASDVELSTTADANSAPGEYPITLDPASLDGAQATNYDITVQNGVLHIFPGLQMVGEPTFTIAGEAIRGFPTSIIPSVRLVDDVGTPVALSGAPVFVSVNQHQFSGAGDQSGASVVKALTDASGVASFDQLILETADLNYSLLFGVGDDATQWTSLRSFNQSLAGTGFSEVAETSTQSGVLYVEYSATTGGTDASVGYKVGSMTYTLLEGAQTESGSFAIQYTAGDDVSLFANSAGSSAALEVTGLQFATSTVSSLEFPVIHSKGASISVVGQPQDAYAGDVIGVFDVTSGNVINAFPRVEVRDTFNNLVEGVNVDVSVSGVSFVDSSSKRELTTTDGTSTWNGLIITQAGTYKMTFTPRSTSVPVILSEWFDILAGEPASIRVVTEPTSVQVGDTQSPSSVLVEDMYGNPVPGVDVSVSEGTVIGATTQTTGANGQAVFNDLAYSQTGTGKVLGFIAGLLSDTSAGFDVTTRALSVAGIDSSKVYGDSDPFFDYNITGGSLLSGDTLSGSLSREPGETVGFYDYTLGTLSHPNYTISLLSGEMSVTQKDLMISVNNAERRINEADPTFSYADFSSGLVNGDTMDDVTGGSVSFQLASTDINSTKGDYPFEIGIDPASLNGPSAANYFIDVYNGDLSILSGPVSKLALVSDAAQTVAGEVVEGLDQGIVLPTVVNHPAVQAQDAQGNPVAGALVSVTLKRALGADLDGVNFVSGTFTVTTDSNGVAEFPDLVLTKAGVDYILEFNVIPQPGDAPVASLDSEEFSVTAASPSTIVFTKHPEDIIAGNTVGADAFLSDRYDNPIRVPGIRINVELKTGSIASGTTQQSTNSQGEVTFSGLEIQTAGTYQLRLSSTLSGISPKNSETFIVSADDTNATLIIVTHPTGSTAGEPIQGVPTVEVLDPYGNPISGVSISVNLNGAGLNSGTTTQTTDSNGSVGFPDLITNKAGTGYSLSFDGGGYGNQTSNQFEVDAAALDHFLVQETDTGNIRQQVAGVEFWISLRARDVYNNIVKGFNDSVELNVTNSLFGDGSLSPDVPSTTPDFVSGMLIGYPVNLTKATLNAKIGVSGQGKTGESNEFVVIAADPAILTFEEEPETTVAGNPIANSTPSAPKVKLTDEFGNINAGERITITVNLFDFEPESVTEGVTDANGEILFDELILPIAWTDYFLSAEADALPGTPVDSQNFDILAGVPADIIVYSHPAFSFSGWPLTNSFFDAPSVWVVDQYFNHVPGAIVDVELLQYGTPINELFGTTSEVTDDFGFAAFLDLFVFKAGYGLSLRFTSGAASADSLEFMILHGQPVELVMEMQPQGGVAGAPLDPAPAVKLLDFNFNPVPNGLVKVYERNGALIINGWEERTDVNGVATFDNLVFQDAGSGYELVFEAQLDFVTGVWSDSFDVQSPSGSVVGRYLVYNDSVFDGNNPAAEAADDGAIATDKTALLPGGTASFENVSAFNKGITAIMFDIDGANGQLTMDDLWFRVGNSSNLNNWRPAPEPTSFTVRSGEGVGGSDRVTVTWEARAIVGRWLEVTVLNTNTTGLAQPDHFYFGSAPGETGNSVNDFLVNAIDLRRVVVGGSYNTEGSAIIEFYDFNRDGKVNFDDYIVGLANGTTGATQLIQLVLP